MAPEKRGYPREDLGKSMAHEIETMSYSDTWKVAEELTVPRNTNDSNKC